MFNLAVAKLFEKVFGVTANQIETQVGNTPYGNLKAERSQEGMSFYGTNHLGKKYFLPVSVGGIELPLPIMQITTRKKIVHTDMLNRAGSVKEVFGQGDYYITIQGICLQEDITEFFPENQLALLEKVNKPNTNQPINNVITAKFGIKQVVVERLDIMPKKGFEGVVPYEMTLISDIPFSLQLAKV